MRYGELVAAISFAVRSTCPDLPHFVVGAVEWQASVRIHFVTPVPGSSLVRARDAALRCVPVWMDVVATCARERLVVACPSCTRGATIVVAKCPVCAAPVVANADGAHEAHLYTCPVGFLATAGRLAGDTRARRPRS